MMYRVLLISCGALALAGCSSMPDWLNTKVVKFDPPMDSVRFESEPPGAEAVANGQTCRTPCALALPADKNLTVTFSLTGYQPENESIETVNDGWSPHLRPNPVVVELTPLPPPPKPDLKKKPAKKPVAKRPAKPKTTAAPAPAPTAMAPTQQQPAPWPGTAPQR